MPNAAKPMSFSIRFSFVAAVLAAFSGCQNSSTSLPVISGETMGTQYRVTLGKESVSADDAETLRRVIETELVAFNEVFSTYEPQSDISRFNSAAAGDLVAVDKSLIECWNRARAISENSKGAFDPTVGPLVNRWQFGPGREKLDPPDQAEIDELKSRVGYTKIEVRPIDESKSNENAEALTKTVDGVRLDLSAIAKGRGVDHLCGVLEANGFESFLVDIGGELRAAGRKPNGDPWRVAVRNPSDPFDTSRQSKPAELNDAAIATSGDYFNFHEVDGVRYGHTIDPRSGRPVSHELASVTVVACDCETADAYATTLMVLGADAGYDWSADHRVAAMLVERDGSVRLAPAYGVWLRTGEISCPE